VSTMADLTGLRSLTKDALNVSATSSFDEALTMEARYQQVAFHTPETRQRREDSLAKESAS
jgi:hypothetical protein